MNHLIAITIVMGLIAGLGIFTFRSIRNRLKLIADCRQRLIDAKLEAFFGNWQNVFTAMRIVARECPVSLEALALDESLKRWCKIKGQKYLRSYDGRSFYE